MASKLNEIMFSFVSESIRKKIPTAIMEERIIYDMFFDMNVIYSPLL